MLGLNAAFKLQNRKGSPKHRAKQWIAGLKCVEGGSLYKLTTIAATPVEAAPYLVVSPSEVACSVVPLSGAASSASGKPALLPDYLEQK
jgi:hypothetical protein